MTKQLTRLHIIYWISVLVSVSIVALSLWLLSGVSANLQFVAIPVITMATTVGFVMLARHLEKRRIGIDPEFAQYSAALKNSN